MIDEPRQSEIGNDALSMSASQSLGLLKLIEKIATSDTPTVLLEGESGTGKNLAALLIHQKSRRAAKPFMEVNCASLPETLIETELFGHEKGAFTDAKQEKKGLFEVARGGTLFLNEIGEMSLPTQAKLLHAIENHKFRRVGGVEEIETDIRIIAATNVDLKQAVAQRQFREDLYYRLQLIPIRLLPLRDRAEEIPILIQYFIEKLNPKYGKKVTGVTPEAAVFLKTYPWPGNVRELKNTIERVMLLEDAESIQVHHLPHEIRSGGQAARYTFQIPAEGVNLEALEKELIAQALEKATGNQTRASKLLGISRHTLRYRMEKFGLKFGLG